MAAAPMTPAPMNRTSVFQTVRAWVATSTPGIGCRLVMTGTSTPQAMARPANMARRR
jgi:hypothetical protein